jgi:hypothetical protein
MRKRQKHQFGTSQHLGRRLLEDEIRPRRPRESRVDGRESFTGPSRRAGGNQVE